ncbi:MAG: serine--tRNA ligase [Candidatus Micrarchaeota archaeon]
MIDIKIVRENPEIIRNDLEKRQSSFQLDELIEKDKEWRENKQKLEKMKAEKNKVTAEIAKKKDEKKMKQMKELGSDIKKTEELVVKLEAEVKNLLMRCPNILHDSVPTGKDDGENQTAKEWGKKRTFDFELKPNGEIAEALDIADFERATKASGSGFVYVKGELALLDQALMQFAISHLNSKGYVPVETPMMMCRKAYEGVTDLSDFESVMYKIEGEDLYMIATSEHPLGAMFMNEIISEEKLPIKFAGISACFRKEIGKHGVDTRGFFRMHQFNKIEQFVFCKPEQSWALHEEILKNAEEIFQKLEIPYRVVNVCTGDIGTVAAKKYDIEAWSPRQNKYVEVVSCSNCTDYQARRLNIRMGKAGGDKKALHTLNSTAVATSRALVVILENYQNKDGTITVPKVLQPYMNGVKVIGKKK